MKKTLITHFRNEEYLLPWFIRQHVDIFDEAVMIDYASTDASREIIHELAPHWTIVPSRNREFDAIAADAEVMDHERQHEGWKAALNVTEFLIGDAVRLLDELPDEVMGIKLIGRTLVDVEVGTVPRPDAPLTEQKPWGFDVFQWEFLRTLGLFDDLNPMVWNQCHPGLRNRLIHRHPTGRYLLGRHDWQVPGVVPATDLHLWWFGLSPWNPEGQGRKENARATASQGDRKRGVGPAHWGVTPAQRDDLRALLAPFATVRSWTPSESVEAMRSVLRYKGISW